MPLETVREKGAHLLRRFGLGASEAELDFYLKDGLNGAVDRLLAADAPETFEFDPTDFKAMNGLVPMPVVVGGWALRLIETRRPLQERMTVFWHDHFATSAAKVNLSGAMYEQNGTLRRNALGSFRTLLHEMSKDPAMLFWLDNQENVRGKPNENFAREVMELFTLGIDGGYTEQDVLEAARAFTGWAFTRRLPQIGDIPGVGQYVFRRQLHDNGTKEVLGSKGNLTGEDVLNVLLDHPRTSEYLTLKLWEWFVYPKPEPALIQRHAKRFRESNYDIRALLKEIMRSSEFYSPKAERSIVKNPADHVVATLRQLGYGSLVRERLASAEGEAERRRAFAPAAIASTAMRDMGMFLLYPPDVAGWETGAGWISSATMVERIGWADRLFGPGSGRKLGLRYPAASLFTEDPSPTGVVSKLLSVFDAPITPARRAIVLDSVFKITGGGSVTPATATDAATTATRLIFSTPEFQFC